jgi:hypothetical protein
MQTRHLALPLMLAAAACGTRGGDAAADRVAVDVPGWRLEHAARVGGPDAGEQEMLYSAQEVSEDPEGRFYVLNYGDRRIQVFDSAGRFLRNLGRRGRGPGEFTSPMGVASVGSDAVYVLETVPSRFVRYRRSTGEFVDNSPIEAKQLIPVRMNVGGDGRVALEFMTMLMRTSESVSASLVAWVDTAGGIPRTAVQFDSTAKLRHNRRNPGGPAKSVVTDPPFAPRPVWALDGRGGVLYGDGAEYVVHRAAPGTAPAVAFRGEGDPVPVTRADRDEFLASPRGKLFTDYQFLEHKPYFNGLLVDHEGMVWVQRPAPEGGQLWEVRRPDGRKAGEVRLPAGSRVLNVSRTSVYVMEVDEDDVETLHRYRLVRG